ncbi:MAG: hypothetical protein NC832_01005 [Candidatus Omnitrophica bacterium]|nr:hypothetical protein [Candidatus Omnitrophota bacterium]
MKRFFLVAVCCLLFSGCLAGVKKEQKKTQKEEILPESKEPYGKYTLETADVEVWFYDTHFVYFDRDRKVSKNYETIERDSK